MRHMFQAPLRGTRLHSDAIGSLQLSWTSKIAESPIAWRVRCGVHTPKVDQPPYLTANMADLLPLSFLKDTHRVR
jgi:hypothetical protein